MYSQSAERLVKRAFLRGDSRHLLPCPIDQGNARCAEDFIQSFGRRAFRRPLDPRETALYRKIFQSESSFLPGVQAVMESMLQAPAFLFWMQESPRPEWKAYATASRISYFLWNTMPDDALLCRGRQGELDTPEGVERIARQMLTDPKRGPPWMSSFRSGSVSTARWAPPGSAARSRCSAANWCFRCSKNPDALSATWFGTGRTSWTCSGRRTDS